MGVRGGQGLGWGIYCPSLVFAETLRKKPPIQRLLLVVCLVL